MPVPARTPPSDVIPLEAPTAPTEQEWARMTSAQREQAVDALLASESQEEIDEREAMAEGDPHFDAKTGIRRTLRSHFGRLGRRIYVGADIKVYYPGKKGFTPDVIAVTDVDPTPPRDCWMVSQEGKGVDLALEVHSKGKWRKDFVDNVKKYAALGIREYFVHDLRREIVKGYRLPRAGAQEYQPIPSRGGRFRSEVLELDLALEAGEMRFYEGSALLVTDAELIGKLEQMVDAAGLRVEEQEARAEEQEARTNQAVAHLSSAILTILAVRGIEVAPDTRDRIVGTADLEVLERWLLRAATIAASADLFLDS